MTYTYNPCKINEYGRDRLRFELGDAAVTSGGAGAVLSDEEYDSALEGFGTDGEVTAAGWRRVKLRLLEAILFRLSYQVNTRIDVLSYDAGALSEIFKALYDSLKAETRQSAAFPSSGGAALARDPYYYMGMIR